MKKKNYIMLALIIVATELIGFASALIAGDIKGEYGLLVKPPLSPPNWIFGVVWSILYCLMAVSLFLVLYSKSDRVNPREKMFSIILYCSQLTLNFIWSILFFGNDQRWIAFVIIVVLDVAVVSCIRQFGKISKPAALILIPYLAWILFATYLNLAFAVLN